MVPVYLLNTSSLFFRLLTKFYIVVSRLSLTLVSCRMCGHRTVILLIIIIFIVLIYFIVMLFIKDSTFRVGSLLDFFFDSSPRPKGPSELPRWWIKDDAGLVAPDASPEVPTTVAQEGAKETPWYFTPEGVLIIIGGVLVTGLVVYDMSKGANGYIGSAWNYLFSRDGGSDRASVVSSSSTSSSSRGSRGGRYLEHLLNAPSVATPFPWNEAIDASMNSLRNTFTNTRPVSTDLVKSVLRSFDGLDFIRESSPQLEGLIRDGAALLPDVYTEARNMLACEAVMQRFREILVDHFTTGDVAAWVNQGVAALPTNVIQVGDKLSFVNIARHLLTIRGYDAPF
jgi:hypothetical protein